MLFLSFHCKNGSRVSFQREDVLYYREHQEIEYITVVALKGRSELFEVQATYDNFGKMMTCSERDMAKIVQEINEKAEFMRMQ